MAVFLLIHGGAHGGWCWDRLVPRLEARGHRVLAPDLAGMGADPTPAGEVTMARWAHFVADLARKQQQPVVLVGHSRGGSVISEAAELAPELVLGLIYVTAVLLPAGLSNVSGIGADTPQLVDNFVANAEGTALAVKREIARELFYNRTDRVDAEWALDRLCPDPISPNHAAMTVTAERWGRLPRAYVECSDDHALPLVLQRQMQAALPCDPVITLDSDHSPFLCRPDELTDALEQIAAEFITRRAQSESA